ncbi:MAG: hypothetical protein QOE97_3929 [Pseudonocardiales bacterium]|nr:hypothetical protein [Pseudonocardiales bacterium]
MDYGHDVQFGSFITPVSGAPHNAVALAQLSERAGLDLVTFQDHPYQPGFLDTWTLLSYTAALTDSVRLSANVLNLPLRQPAVVARSAASLDLLSSGRVELAMGAGSFWDAIEAMGGRRLTPSQSVQALDEAISVIRGIWAAGDPSMLRVGGEFHRVHGAKRGPAPAHDIGIWIGAYKPRMLRLIGRRADGWLPTLGYLQPGDLARGNAIIDEAAAAAGRDPAQIRRLLNIGPGVTPDELAELAVGDGISTFIVGSDDPDELERFGQEIAPAVRAMVAAQRSGRADRTTSAEAQPPVAEVATPARPGTDALGVTPTSDPGVRLAAEPAWDESTRPHRPPQRHDSEYTDRGRAVGQHLIDVHDHLRTELTRLRSLIEQVRAGTVQAAQARSEINDMTMRQNDWTLGAFCASYCRLVAGHHGLEDDAIFPHLRERDPDLVPVIDRLEDEHRTIHDLLERIDRALVEFIADPEDFSGLQASVDLLTDALLSHLSYEEYEIVEPLARLGFYPGQV